MKKVHWWTLVIAITILLICVAIVFLQQKHEGFKDDKNNKDDKTPAQRRFLYSMTLPMGKDLDKAIADVQVHEPNLFENLRYEIALNDDYVEKDLILGPEHLSNSDFCWYLMGAIKRYIDMHPKDEIVWVHWHADYDCTRPFLKDALDIMSLEQDVKQVQLDLDWLHLPSNTLEKKGKALIVKSTTDMERISTMSLNIIDQRELTDSWPLFKLTPSVNDARYVYNAFRRVKRRNRNQPIIQTNFKSNDTNIELFQYAAAWLSQGGHKAVLFAEPAAALAAAPKE